MKYLAITQPTASWMLSNGSALRLLEESLPSLMREEALKKTILAVGSFRAAASPDGSVLGIWNKDYLTSLGEETWGFIRCSPPYGLLEHPDVMWEVFEREVTVINQRLRALLLDPSYYHRVDDAGVHSCIAGRGNDARKLRLLYCEGEVNAGSGSCRSIVCLGPEWQDQAFNDASRVAGNSLSGLARTANLLISGGPRRPVSETGVLRGLTSHFQSLAPQDRERSENVPTLEGPIAADEATGAYRLTFDEWMKADSPLTAAQRRIVESEDLQRQPVRIVGAAGSGKTLTMMLLAFSRLKRAEDNGEHPVLLYLCHNQAMKQMVWERFVDLGGARFMESTEPSLVVATLFDYSRRVLGEDDTPVIDADALETKAFQRSVVRDCIREVLARRATDVERSPLLSQVVKDDALLSVFSSFVSDEISVAIKGHELTRDEQTYVESERRLSRLHGNLDQNERRVLFDIFREYHREVFEGFEVFDADDLAMSLLHRLRAPIWEMRRRKKGYDFVFVDETQLFNENERRVFPLLTKRDVDFVPVVLALDEAQQIRSSVASGLGLLGIADIADEKLESIHRCSPEILRLAFFIIQRTTDLFGPDFPDFTDSSRSTIPSGASLSRPQLRQADGPLEAEVLAEIGSMRKRNIRQIAVVCHSERYWAPIENALRSSGLATFILSRRGDQAAGRGPMISLASPETVGRPWAVRNLMR
jgi:hypothetical protein